MANPFLEVLGYVGQTLDKPGAAVRGLLAGRPDQLANLLPFSDTLGITDPAQRTRGTDLLGLDPETTGGMLGGMGAELAMDPLNWMMGAGLLKNVARNQFAKGAYKADVNAFHNVQAPIYEEALREREAAKMGELLAKSSNRDRQALLGSGGMPEEIADKTLAIGPDGLPVRTYHGTNTAYDKYDPKFDRGGNLVGPGMYTTEDTGISSSYAKSPQARTATRAERMESLEELNRQIDEAVARAGGMENVAVDPRSVQRMAKQTLFPHRYANATTKQGSYDMLAADMQALGVDPPSLESLRQRMTTPNTRMQYLDVRKPLDLQRQWTPDEANALLQELHGPPIRNPDGTIDPIFSPRQAMPDTPPGQLTEVPLYDMLAGSHGYDDAAKTAFNKLLAEHGYDTIQHTGGITMGGRRHPVRVAMNPENIYNPWIIPTERAMPVIPEMPRWPDFPVEPRMARQSPLLAGLLGQNTLGRVQ